VSELPAGTVTFLFTDVEGSTRLLGEFGPERYAEALAEHRRLVRQAIASHGGSEVDTQGDAFFVAFPTASGALAAAAEAQASLASGPIAVRMGIHSGEPLRADEGYVGMAVHRAARIAAAAHGGQVLVSEASRSLLDDDSGLRDLGLHRLKDLAAPQRLFQLGPGEFPALKTLDRTNLPVPATPFLGRSAELADVHAMLARDDVRLLTLVGPGGTGKTRLALQAAAEAGDAYPGGVTWVALAPVQDPQLVMPAVAAALGLRAEGVSAAEATATALQARRALLLLDNAEHVLDAMTEVASLLARCPDLTALITSREVLRLTGEHVYAVDPMRHEEAMALFVRRARAADPAFEATPAVSELCSRLDDLPLAVELAASRTRTLSADALLERIGQSLDLFRGARDVEERQRTLRATIEWSHEMLTPEERDLFARLAVFVSGSPLEAVEEICGAELLTLESLVEHSLVRHRIERDGSDRYWMLETIRVFAVEQLEGSGEAAGVRERHARWYESLARDSGDRFMRTFGDERELDLFVREQHELRSVLRHLEAGDEIERIGWLASDLVHFWYFVGNPREGERWIRPVLEGDQALPEALVARLESGLSAMVVTSDRAAAYALSERAVGRYARVDDPLWHLMALTTLGNADVDPPGRGSFSMTSGPYVDAVALAAQLGLPSWVDMLHGNMAIRALYAGELDLAEELAAPYADADMPTARASINATLALVAVERREYAAARLPAERFLRACSDQVHGWIPYALEVLAAADAGVDDAGRAAVLLGAADRLYTERGITLDSFERRARERTEDLLRSKLRDETLAELRAVGEGLTTDDAVAIALGEREPPTPAPR
jgi:predicted ATPase/class 3 adenylate cyclase